MRCTFLGGERWTAINGPAHTVTQREARALLVNTPGYEANPGAKGSLTDADDDEVRMQRNTSRRVGLRVEAEDDSTADWYAQSS